MKEYHEPAILTLNLENLSALPQKAQQALGLFGSVDIIINNAGISYRGCIQDTSVEVDQKLMTVNYLGHVAFIKGNCLMLSLNLCMLCLIRCILVSTLIRFQSFFCMFSTVLCECCKTEAALVDAEGDVFLSLHHLLSAELSENSSPLCIVEMT